MQVETKGNIAGASLAPNAEVDVDVAGFSWTPDAVWACIVSTGTQADTVNQQISFPGPNDSNMSIVSFTMGANKITVRLRNNQDVSTYYYNNIIITAWKN